MIELCQDILKIIFIILPWCVLRNHPSILNFSEFEQVVVRIACFKISLDNWIIFDFRIRILSLELNLIQSCIKTSLEHQMSSNIENLKSVIWSFVDNEVEWFKIIWSLSLNLFCVHSKEEIVLWHFHVFEISNENISTNLDLFCTLAQHLCKHIIICDKCRETIRNNNTVNLLWKLEVVIKDILNKQLKLVDHTLVCQFFPCNVNHLLRDVKAENLSCTSLG